MGITLARNGKYTIRRSKELLESKVNDNGSLEISWILIDRKKLKIKEGGKYERLRIKGVEYLFNTDNYKVYDLNYKYYGKLEKGEIKK